MYSSPSMCVYIYLMYASQPCLKVARTETHSIGDWLIHEPPPLINGREGIQLRIYDSTFPYCILSLPHCAASRYKAVDLPAKKWMYVGGGERPVNAKGSVLPDTLVCKVFLLRTSPVPAFLCRKQKLTVCYCQKLRARMGGKCSVLSWRAWWV